MALIHQQVGWQNHASRVQPVEAKTASFSVFSSDFGKIFTTRGAAAAVTMTLPPAATSKGGVVTVIAIADENLIVSGTADELVVFNDAAADTIAFQTAGEIIGGMFFCVCDGTSWCVAPIATETQTVTITT